VCEQIHQKIYREEYAAADHDDYDYDDNDDDDDDIDTDDNDLLKSDAQEQKNLESNIASSSNRVSFT
jgi:hypothetical protein